MAKLSKCRTCSETVSRRAKHCPKCGEGRPASRRIGMKSIALMLVVSAAFAGGMSGRRAVHVVSKQLNAWADQAGDEYRANIASRIEPAAGQE
jgi:hypothetical protein